MSPAKKVFPHPHFLPLLHPLRLEIKFSIFHEIIFEQYRFSLDSSPRDTFLPARKLIGFLPTENRIGYSISF